MQLSNILTVLAVAMTATALPANEIRGSGDSVSQCNNNQHSVCCNGLLGGILCTVTILGGGAGSCGGQAYCCETNVAQGGLVNINALNCVKLL